MAVMFDATDPVERGHAMSAARILRQDCCRHGWRLGNGPSWYACLWPSAALPWQAGVGTLKSLLDTCAKKDFVPRQQPGEQSMRHGNRMRSLLKLGIVSDIHCNIDGLDRALETMGQIDALLCLGDSIFEYRFSNAVIGRLRELDALTILGNHEEVFLGTAGARARSRAEIDGSLLSWLAERPQRRELRIDGKRILMVHSTPWDPRGSYVPPTSSELLRFGDADADIVLYGHTHQQVVRRVGRVLVINPGSAGDGRDPRNGRQLSCAVLDTVTEEVAVHNFVTLPVEVRTS